MSDREIELYDKAGRLAKIALGKTARRPGRGWEPTWIADDDPMAWWCLTECIVQIAKEYRQ